MTEIISTDGEGSETVATQSVSEFFDTLARRTVVVRENMTTEYVYAGHTYNDDSERVVALFHSTHGSKLLLDLDSCRAENAWRAVEIEGGGLKCVEPIVLNLMNSAHDRQVQHDTLQEAFNELRDQLASARRDFEQVNTFINDYARAQDMCEEYERRLETWNESLALLKLLGRPRDWSIHIRVGGRLSPIEGYIDVNARSEDEAKSLARQLSSESVLRQLAGYDTWEVEILS